MDGLGVYTCKDGRKYDGVYKEGKKHGQFKFTNKKKVSSKRMYEDDKQVQRKKTKK